MPRSPLTPARRARLEKLAAYLEGLPKDYLGFEMRTFFRSEDQSEVDYALHNGGLKCGTVACALGHGPAAGILFPEELVRDPWWPSWNDYASLFVGEGLEENPHYMWLFFDDWEKADNTPRGAAARIRYLLANGGPPRRFKGPEARYCPLYAPYRIDAKATANA